MREKFRGIKMFSAEERDAKEAELGHVSPNVWETVDIRLICDHISARDQAMIACDTIRDKLRAYGVPEADVDAICQTLVKPYESLCDAGDTTHGFAMENVSEELRDAYRTTGPDAPEDGVFRWILRVRQENWDTEITGCEWCEERYAAAC